ncbi:MAG: right-handed parallel beta-helix repeat-containing protein [Chloroflexota bacterium]
MSRLVWLFAVAALALLTVRSAEAVNATIVVNSTADASDLAPGLPCDTSAAAGNQCTLRAAIEIANLQAGADVINFSIGTAGNIPTINLASALPTITQSLSIDGTSSPAAFVELHRTSGSFNGLIIDSSGVTIKGLVINSFILSGINIMNDQKGSITGNRIGTSKAGTADMGNSGDGISVTGNVESLTISQNLIAGNHGNGIHLTSATGVAITSNRIGLDPTNLALPNDGDGIKLESSPSITIGGSATTTNFIGNNALSGIEVTGTASTGLSIRSNRIGLGSGSPQLTASPNSDGIRLVNAPGASVRDNVISGNTGIGLSLVSATNESIQGNIIGLNSAGTAALPNSTGVYVFGTASGNSIGVVGGTRNTISGNSDTGVLLDFNTHGNSVNNNYIGTNVAGTAGIGNVNNGIVSKGLATTIQGNLVDASAVGLKIDGANATTVIGNMFSTTTTGGINDGQFYNDTAIQLTGTAHNNTVGGPADTDRNIIDSDSFTFGAAGIGINIGVDATNNTVLGNYIGVTAAGDDGGGGQPRGNTTGISISGPTNHIGPANVISNNGHQAISLNGTTATGNVIELNKIGVRPTGEPQGNQSGIILFNGPSDNDILDNTIANNGFAISLEEFTDGITVRNYLAPNDFYNNIAAINFDFGPSTPTQDHLDADTGPNGLQNSPIITQATTDFVDWTLDSEANSTYEVSLYHTNPCDDSGFGEGLILAEDFAGNVTTDANGHASGHTLSSENLGTILTMTASRVVGTDKQATSMFSACATVVAAPTPTPTPSPTLSPSPTPTNQTPGPSPTPTPTGGPTHSATPTPTGIAASTPATQTPPPTSIPILIGDADCNGAVNAQDAIALLAITSGLQNACLVAASNPALPQDDTNCDGHIDDLDALDVLLSVSDLPELPSSSDCPAVGQQVS